MTASAVRRVEDHDFRPFEEVLRDLVVEESETDALATLTLLLHDLVARVRKDRVDGKLTLALVVTPAKDGVDLLAKWSSKVTATLASEKAERRFVSKRAGQLELFGEGGRVAVTVNPWAGRFGAEYAERNTGDAEARSDFFDDVVPYDMPVLELGCGRGVNLAALKLAGHSSVRGVEVNPEAVALARAAGHDVLEGDALRVAPPAADLVLTSGFLIHVPPADLPLAYAQVAACARRYALLVEYHSPRPREVAYRDGVSCWARDFAGEFLDAHPAFEYADAGFLWKRAHAGAWDDVTWFLLERRT